MIADVVNRQNIRMIKRRSRSCFLLEAAQAVGVIRKRSGQDFDGDFAVQAGVARAVDFTHPARADFGDDVVMRNCRIDSFFHLTRFSLRQPDTAY